MTCANHLSNPPQVKSSLSFTVSPRRRIARKESNLADWGGVSVLGLLAILILGLCGSAHSSVVNRFVRFSNYATGGSVVHSVAGDFNGDGKLDVVTSNSNGLITFLAGDGHGGFAAPVTLLHPTSTASQIVVGDFNHDGKLDIVYLPLPSIKVYLLVGNGNGTFQAPVGFADGTSPGVTSTFDQLQSAVLTSSGSLDIIVGTPHGINVLLNNGSGSFAAALHTNTAISSTNSFFTTGDFNHDGSLDIAVADYAGDQQTLIGHHNGTFTALTPVTGDPNALFSLIQCAAADVDGDGKIDLVFAQAGNNYPDGVGDGGFIVAKGHGDGTFDVLTFPQGGAAFFFGGLSLADVNGDGKVDVLSLNSSAGAITVSLNNGSGGFASAVQYAVNRGPTTITVGDFNGDGKPDIASGEPHGLSILLNLGGGVYRAPITLDAEETAAAAVAIDLNRDSIVDIAEISSSQAFRVPFGQVYAFLGSPKASFTAASAEAGLQDTFLMAVTDFNGDGFTDVCYVDSNQELQIETYSPSQGFVGGWPTVNLPSQPNAIVAGDFNGDGKGDIAFTDGSSLQVMLGVGDGNFSSPQQYTVGNNPVSLAIRDVNGDGKSDLLVVNQGSNDVSVLLGNGNGTFQAEHHFLAGASPNVITVGDFNRDNKIESRGCKRK